MKYYKLCGGTVYKGVWIQTHLMFLRKNDIYMIKQPKPLENIIDIWEEEEKVGWL